MAEGKLENMRFDTDTSTQESEGRQKLRSWLNKSLRVSMTDGRTLIGVFLCTDRDKNVILGSCQEYIQDPDNTSGEDPRVLGLAMVPGHHILKIEYDDITANQIM
ncbi:N-alpha-acetyltransferase 38, NatC auxiliary subunit-like [Branchiostoma floridae x Branchiostoma japonicum]